MKVYFATAVNESVKVRTVKKLTEWGQFVNLFHVSMEDGWWLVSFPTFLDLKPFTLSQVECRLIDLSCILCIK